MSDRVRVERRRGRLVAVKQARDPAGVERLHREARMLAVVRLPGAVELVELVDGDGSAELVTAYVGSHSAATTRPRTFDQAVALTTAVAAIVADLHGLGIVHARLDPTHVLIDDDGRPVLCGFGGAGLVGDPMPARPSDTEAATAPTLRPARDVYALGRLLEVLTTGLPPGDHAGRRRFAGSAAGGPNRNLRHLVEAATAEDPSCRPSARSFADAVQALAPTAVLAPPRPNAAEASRSSMATPVTDGPGVARPLPRRPSTTAEPLVHGGRALRPGRAAPSAHEPHRPRTLPRRPSTEATTTGPAVVRRDLPGSAGRTGLRDHRTEPASASAPLATTHHVSTAPAADESGPVRAHRRRGVTTAALLAAVVAMGLGVASTRVGARPTLDAANGRPPAAPPPSGANPGPAPGAADLATPSAGATGGDPAPIGGSTATPASETTATPGSPPEPPPTTAPPARSGATADLTCPSSRTPEAPAVPAPPCTTSVPAPASGVVIAGTRYAIGEPGDEILVGDWRCDGTLGVAVVRPVWGDVYLFERLPDGDEERTAVQVAHLGSGARLETGAAVPDGCPALVGRFADGSTAVVTVPDALPAPRPRPGAAP